MLVGSLAYVVSIAQVIELDGGMPALLVALDTAAGGWWASSWWSQERIEVEPETVIKPEPDTV